MCLFLETIKLENGQFFHLNYHQKRVNRTFLDFFQGKKIFDLEKIVEILEKPKNGLYRCRVVYHSDVQKIEFVEQKVREIKSLKIVNGDTIDYSYKYIDRELIQELVKQKEACDDILIIKNGLVTDTSIGNILFFNGKDWVTPDSPLLPGTTRDRLINENLIRVKKIGFSDILKYNSFQVVNALIPFNSEIFYSTENIHQ